MAVTDPRPSCIIELDIDEALFSEELRLDVDRCYTYVSTTLLHTHETPEGEKPVNTARIMLMLGAREYLRNAEDADAERLWNEVVEQWLSAMTFKLSNQMVIFNKRREHDGNPQLDFDWFDYELQGGELHVLMHLDSTSALPQDEVRWLTRVRRAFNEGVLGAGVKSVALPARASYEQQVIDGLAAKAEREEQRAAQEAAEAAVREAEAAEAEREAEEGFAESPELLQENMDEEAAEALSWQEELEERYRLPEPDFALDFALWDVTYADGSTRTFDSHTGTFAEAEHARSI